MGGHSPVLAESRALLGERLGGSGGGLLEGVLLVLLHGGNAISIVFMKASFEERPTSFAARPRTQCAASLSHDRLGRCGRHFAARRRDVVKGGAMLKAGQAAGSYLVVVGHLESRSKSRRDEEERGALGMGGGRECFGVGDGMGLEEERATSGAGRKVTRRGPPAVALPSRVRGIGLCGIDAASHCITPTSSSPHCSPISNALRLPALVCLTSPR